MTIGTLYRRRACILKFLEYVPSDTSFVHGELYYGTGSVANGRSECHFCIEEGIDQFGRLEERALLFARFDLRGASRPGSAGDTRQLDIELHCLLDSAHVDQV